MESPDIQKGNVLDRGAQMVVSRILPGVFSSGDVVINDLSFFRDLLFRGSLGLGDSYMAGKWDSSCIDEVVNKILQTGAYQKFAFVYDAVREFRSRLFNLQNKKRAKRVIEEHYDLPVGFYQAFLGPKMKYTCLDYTTATDIETAEIDSMRRVCEKLELKPGDRVADYGGGWGGLAGFMADEYGVRPTIVTRSKEQAQFARETHGDKIEVVECDYRDIPADFAESFDASSAIGIWEHIGHKNYGSFLKVIDHNLKKSGRLLIHTLFTSYSSLATNPWLNKHIFPEGELTPKETIIREISKFFTLSGNESGDEAFEEITPNYFPTLHAWKDRLTDAYRGGRVQISEQEFRKWVFYFMSCAGAIKAEYMRVGQFLARKD
ncbi:class I SAM-dependent methyltransferase [Patescibacteria group bacterium]|nr:class I SAM-dependent methyltransferase [Patescibacteria group bacterium]MBU1123331.1 class I SAM-dependent methyltransferase [Patescibacteria group bacterium]